MPKEDLAFALNYTNIHAIDATPTAAERTWLYVGAGIQTITPAPNETTDQTAYYDGGGQASTDVTGGQTVISFSGHRKYGDPAQDYIASLEYEYGQARKTNYRHVAPDGRILENEVTIANIVNGGGDANAKGTFSFEIHNDGTPIVYAGNADLMPESILVQPVAVAVGERASVKVSVEPPTASDACMYAIEDDSIASVTADGKVIGIAPGETKMTIKSALKPSLAAQVKVTVTGEALPDAPSIIGSGYEATKAAVNSKLEVTDGADQTFYLMFDKAIGSNDYLVTQVVQGKTYGLIIEGSKHPEWKKTYWTLSDGRQVDYIDGEPKNGTNAKVDLSGFSGTVETTVYLIGGTADPKAYPQKLTEIGKASINVANA